MVVNANCKTPPAAVNPKIKPPAINKVGRRE